MENGSTIVDDEGSTKRGQAAVDARHGPHGERKETSSASSHRRSLSGTILSKLSFLRPAAEDRRSKIEDAQVDCNGDENQKGRSAGSPAVSPQDQKKTRNRKGSLRKTALLGTGRLRQEGRDKRGSPLDIAIPKDTYTDKSLSANSLSPDSEDVPTPRATYGRDSFSHTARPNGPGLTSSCEGDNESDESLVSRRLTRQSTLGDMSTTDEDDPLIIRNLNVSNGTYIGRKPSTAAADSYFPVVGAGNQRRRSSTRPKSPLATIAIESTVIPEVWDYSETEWWGWVVLFVTWIVFVVGMGSCFEVWSWAWDVGETPYAPPELEDDPTLPIVGYYPALIILTAVMAWVWVVIAWVGMKYFKHAKIPGDDG